MIRAAAGVVGTRAVLFFALSMVGTLDARAQTPPGAAGPPWDLVRFEVSGEVHEVAVAAELGEPTYLTCDAASPSRPRRFVPLTHRVVSR